jgi:prepilin-type N-terminal cleavage/methylation domain-containing protein
MSFPSRGLCRPENRAAGIWRSPFAGRLRSSRSSAAFTLIELLTVIAIIAIIAAMVVGMSSGAAAARKHKVVEALKNKYVTLIENYKANKGFYPPDGLAFLQAQAGNSAPGSTAYQEAYERLTATNLLLYELTGATNLNTQGTTKFYTFDGSNYLAADINAAFGVGGIANSDPSQPRNFFTPLPNTTDYTNYPGPAGSAFASFKGLTVPVQTAVIAANGGFTPVNLNYWHYDSSNTNRHNPNGFDLWAEYLVGRDKQGNPIMVTNGNW